MPHPAESDTRSRSDHEDAPNAHFKRELDRSIDELLLPCPRDAEAPGPAGGTS